ncbi:glutamate--cysteine ligase [Rhodobacteraceae bacterium RKSG542]|uniref:glutamate--cysteine ligase n=1 Tax=Pseudovibrio flavus TaxID=2529854 RepID=UPI0012BC1E95|nr:glutamate--cysteine ligase [Pseudovibrio flavus]MTI15751.1 glutamate--cysteine ligase [Pseudovibrio flavus]
MSAPETLCMPLMQDSSFQDQLSKIRVGIEKESLRVTSDNKMSMHEHPEGIGKALTHKFITTDFSEAQLEFITPATANMADSIQFLRNLHIFTARNLPRGEYFWNASMPPHLEGEESIRIAEYGNSNAARIKTLYRMGLAHRYGKTMQTISGIHYNFSLPEELWNMLQPASLREADPQYATNNGYLSLIRNIQRHGWLVLYLFGATPAIDSSYVQGRDVGLEPLGDETLIAPYGTSLRMSDLGYTSVVQGKLDIHFNSMEDYLEGLKAALDTSEDLYERIGVQTEGHYKQINTHQLQLENELYGSVRPKRNALPGERPITALCRRGIEYIELRSVDINPFLPVGIDEQEAMFFNVFLTYMALSESPSIDTAEQKQLNEQLQLVARFGRKEGLELPFYGKGVTLKEAGLMLLEKMRDLAKAFDEALGTEGAHEEALDAQLEKLKDSSLTPSAKVLAAVKEYGSHQAFIEAIAKTQTDHFKVLPMDKTQEKMLEAQVAQSRAAHSQKEQEQEVSFDKYLNAQSHYFCPPACHRKH